MSCLYLRIGLGYTVCDTKRVPEVTSEVVEGCIDALQPTLGTQAAAAFEASVRQPVQKAVAQIDLNHK